MARGTTSEKLRVLLVEGEAEVVSALMRPLKRDGLSVRTAAGLHEAERALRRPFDAVLLLPPEDSSIAFTEAGSFRVLRSVRRLAGEAAIVVVLHEAQPEDVAAAFRLGAGDVLILPLPDGEPTATVRSSVIRGRSGRSGGELLPSVLDGTDPVTPLRVLLADSDSERATRLADSLARLGHRPHVAVSAEEVATGAGRRTPDLVLFSASIWEDWGRDVVVGFAAAEAQLRVGVLEEGLARPRAGGDRFCTARLPASIPASTLPGLIEYLLLRPVLRVAPTRVAVPDQSEPHALGPEAPPDPARVKSEVAALVDAFRRGTAHAPDLSGGRPKLLDSDPTPARSDLLGAFEREPSLAAALLRTACGEAVRPRTLDLRDVAALLPATALRDLLTDAPGGITRPDDEAWAPLLHNMWLHTVATADAVRRLAPRVGMKRPGTLYTVALLHNVGESLIVEFHRTLGRRPPVGGVATGSLAEDMRRRHEMFGELFLRQWALPSLLARIAGAHHTPESHPAGTPIARDAWLIAGCAAAVEDAGVRFRDPGEQGPSTVRCATALGTSPAAFAEAAGGALAFWSSEDHDEAEAAAEAGGDAGPLPPGGVHESAA